MSELKPCVFLDRDGTINREAGYINHPDRLELIEGAAGAIRRLNEAGILAVVVSNQAGVARGYFSEETLNQTTEHMVRLLEEQGAHLDGIYYALSHPSSAIKAYREDPDQLRKPGLGMIRRAQKELPIDMQRSWMIGDRYNDIIFAHKAGIPGLLVKTGYGLGEYTHQRDIWPENPDKVLRHVGEAVDYILSLS
jgi:D-glycero-D-manno-heptose 1,7-bisphosphate phosphatase